MDKIAENNIKKRMKVVEDFGLNPVETLVYKISELLDSKDEFVSKTDTLESLATSEDLKEKIENLQGVGIGKLSEEQKAAFEEFIGERVDAVAEHLASLIEEKQDTKKRTSSYIDKKSKETEESLGKKIDKKTSDALKAITHDELVKKLREKAWIKLSDVSGGKEVLDSQVALKKQFVKMEKTIKDLRKEVSDLRQIAHRGQTCDGNHCSGGGSSSTKKKPDETFHIQTEDGTNILTEDGTNVDHQ